MWCQRQENVLGLSLPSTPPATDLLWGQSVVQTNHSFVCQGLKRLRIFFSHRLSLKSSLKKLRGNNWLQKAVLIHKTPCLEDEFAFTFGISHLEYVHKWAITCTDILASTCKALVDSPEIVITLKWMHAGGESAQPDLCNSPVFGTTTWEGKWERGKEGRSGRVRQV